jgi:TPR repeat protein
MKYLEAIKLNIVFTWISISFLLSTAALADNTLQKSPEVLISEAAGIYQSIEKPYDTSSLSTLKKVRTILDQIVSDYPASDIAVMILLQDQIEGIDVAKLDFELAKLSTTVDIISQDTPIQPAKTDIDPDACSMAALKWKELENSTTISELESLAAASLGCTDVTTLVRNRIEDLKAGNRFADNAIIHQCDLLAASQYNTDNPDGIKGTPDDRMDIERAIDICSRASSKFPDNKRIAFNYSNALFASYKRANMNEAIRIAKSLSDENYAIAQFSLGYLYFTGEQDAGIKQDYGKAYKLIKLAADQDLPIAVYVLGQMYDIGIHVAQNRKRAIEYYRKASDLGSPEALHDLGWSYLEGKGVRKNIAEGIRFITLAAESYDYAPAQHSLGVFFHDGKFARRNYKIAQKWFTKAANQSHYQAMLDLGWMYDQGLGMKSNPEQAAQLYMKILQFGVTNKIAASGPSSKDAARELKRLPRSQWKSATVAELQKLLKDLGFYAGKIDGKIGPRTRSAMGKACQC